ncbi:GNAT family N-acetyltransferase [Pseudooceanicola nanhaiensis]|uniref:GNAT family N-acetyltransferase n=1 Tax=Pseudooceanicola nanhaiensis TaxID=375761 RepID=UPI001CD7A33B|nr:GNAT family N-acetyltransferase [Pseudooceanicola nanhaiensis]MCA0920062.1 GNAT family N-acetyltransferase [Pseudooceanicola nanhaiensis]
MTTPPVTFREATAADVPAIVALLAEDLLGAQRENAEPEVYARAFEAILAQPGNRVYVGESGGEIVACYQLTIISNLSLMASDRAQLEAVRVASKMRGQKVGQALMEDVDRRARAAGAALVQFTSNNARKDAHRFYERLGYAPSHVGFKKTF